MNANWNSALTSWNNRVRAYHELGVPTPDVLLWRHSFRPQSKAGASFPPPPVGPGKAGGLLGAYKTLSSSQPSSGPAVR